ncbi:tetratricopeptide repeat protein [Terrarubrum flagellatum]|uniref:tetratricopeptide repeat protein n=1 Tax=Terrirubrum flagellatum TaxID=2895980 RepID=UPI0031451C7E
MSNAVFLRLSVAALALLVAAEGAFANTGKPSMRRPAPMALDSADTSAGAFLAAVGASAQRDTSAAAKLISEALRADPNSPELLERAFEAQLAQGDIAEASRLARRILQREPSNSIARLTLAVEAIGGRQYQSARDRLAPGVRGRAAELTATLLTAWAYAGSQQWGKALETLDKLRQNNGLAIFADYHAGLIADLAGRSDEAEKRLKTAYEAANRAPVRLVEAYARFEARKGNVAEAKTAIATFEQRVGRHPSIRALSLELDAGKPVGRMVGSAQQGAAEALFGLGGEGSRTGDELAGIVYLRLARYLDPKHDLATVTLADIYERLKRHDHAIELYQQIDPSSPLAPSADVQIGLNLETMEKPDEAITRLKQAVDRRPDDVEALSALGNVYRAQKKYREAVDSFSKAIDRVGKPERPNWTLFYFRGSSYERLKEWPKGEADLKKALELFPDQPQALNYLGYTWVDLKINLDEGMKMVQRAVELAPRDGYIVDSLGWAHYRLGQYEDAVRDLERAVLLRPSDPTINDHLGDAYWKVGRKLEAHFQWNHARDLKPEPEDLAKILVKIENGLEDDAPAAAVTTPPSADGEKEKGG